LSQPILNEIYALPRNVDPSTVLSVGNIARVKGTDRLVEAHAFFPKGTRTLIAGSIRDKTFYNELTRTIEKQNIEGIHFLGALERSGIYHALSTASVVACPSRLENMPYALLEALAAGIPCVSFDVGGIGEFLTDGVNGFLPGDQQGFVKAITTLIEDEPLRQKMSNNARISVQGNRSGPVCEELAKIYREILN
jgi:glycosyltransferase involved in cell wall biosynthesis